MVKKNRIIQDIFTIQSQWEPAHKYIPKNITQSLISNLWLDVCNSVQQKQSDTVSVCVGFFFFPLLVWLVGEGLCKCYGQVMHGKCSWNTTRSQQRQEQGGWWCSKRRQKGIAPGHFFLKAPSSPTPMSFSHILHTHTLCGSLFLPSAKTQGNYSTVEEKVSL